MYNKVWVVSLVVLLAGLLVDVGVLLVQSWVWAKVVIVCGFVVLVVGVAVLE